MSDSNDGADGRAERTGSAAATRRAVLRLTGAGIAAAGGIGTASAASSLPRLRTDGRWIVTENGDRFVPRGVSPAALDYVDRTHPKSVEEILRTATADPWRPNTVRLPVTEWAVHDRGTDYVVDELLRPAVDLLAERGVYATIDFHLIRPYADSVGCAEDMVADGWADSKDDLGFGADVPTDDLLYRFWGEVAPAFADDANVLFELFNEPTVPLPWAQYGDHGDRVDTAEDAWLLWRDRAQPWIDFVGSRAPETPLVVGSPDWTSLTRFAPQHPFDGENLIHASHVYPADGPPAEFDDEYGTPAEEVPVFVTEFGWDPDAEFDEAVESGTTSEWGVPFRKWIESYDNVGWLAWCFDDTWAPAFFDLPGQGAGEPWELKNGYEREGWFARNWLRDRNGDRGLPTGAYVIANVNSGKLLEVAGAGTDDGVTAQQWQYTGHPCQEWRLEATGDGSYRIENVHSGKVLDVAGASRENGADVLQWDDWGGDNQRWHVYRDGAGYAIEAVHSEKVLDVEYASTDDGATVHQWDDYGGDNQRWFVGRL